MMSVVASLAQVKAMLTPLEKIGSTKRAASPIITNPSPAIWVIE